MSMEEWPDDHLDELFRKSAEEFEAQYNNDDWLKMSRKLDERDRQTMFDRISRWGGISALIMLLLSGLGWVMYDKKMMGSHQQTIITVLTPARKNAAPPAATSRPGKAEAIRKASATRQPTFQDVPDQQRTQAKGGDSQFNREVNTNDPAGQVTTKPIDRQPATEANRKTSRSLTDLPPVSGSVASATSREKKSDLTGEKPADRLASNYVARAFVKKRSQRTGAKMPAVAGPAAENTLVQPAAKVATRRIEAYPASVGNVPGNRTGNQPDLTTQTAGSSETVSAEQPIDSQWMPALAPATSLSSVVQQVRATTEPAPPAVISTVSARQVIPKSRLSVMLFASPDLSSIGLKNFDRPGTNAGLAIQYQFTDRLSVNTGAMYSTKRYQTYSDEYVWPSYMNLQVWPEDISGVCKMIDVPVNVRYDWLLRRRGDGRAPARWFASAGMTSYFIQHETYSYEYANPDDPKIMTRGWDNQKAGRPGGSFGFSNLNVSVGYECPITNRLSWQIEPFMKVPLKQVGYFKVRLLSTGAFVGLRYRL